MELVFTCPTNGTTFHADSYEIVDNRGVVQDEQGNKILDAKVKLSDPCPVCGARHVYAAAELACPFSP